MEVMQVGQRVARNFLDYKTREVQLMRGEVSKVYTETPNYVGHATVLYDVKWDDGSTGKGFIHGVSLFPEPITVPTVWFPGRMEP